MTLKSLFVSAAFVAAMALPASAGVDDIIKERQACMKGAGALMGVAVPMVKGEKPYDKAAVDAAIANYDKGCANWANFWGADTQKGEAVQTWAKPEIWTDAAGFEAAGGAAYQAVQALKASTDEATFKAAFPAVGAGCQGCHEKFRAPKG
jgi:cytochrome c556